jgi:hypothetical protein
MHRAQNRQRDTSCSTDKPNPYGLSHGITVPVPLLGRADEIIE